MAGGGGASANAMLSPGGAGPCGTGKERGVLVKDAIARRDKHSEEVLILVVVILFSFR